MPDTQPSPQSPLPLAQPHNNHQLFSDYYLNKILSLNAAWFLLLKEAALAKRALTAPMTSFSPTSTPTLPPISMPG